MTYRKYGEAPTTKDGPRPGVVVAEFMGLFAASVGAPIARWAKEAERIQAQFRACRKWGQPKLVQVITFERHDAVYAAVEEEEEKG